MSEVHHDDTKLYRDVTPNQSKRWRGRLRVIDNPRRTP
jgi:hypothetical protein